MYALRYTQYKQRDWNILYVIFGWVERETIAIYNLIVAVVNVHIRADEELIGLGYTLKQILLFYW